jgi:hypothetical protein
MRKKNTPNATYPAKVEGLECPEENLNNAKEGGSEWH